MTRLDQTEISNSVHLPSNITINCGHWTGGTAFSISRLSTFLDLWFQLQGGIGIKSTDVRFRLWPGKARIRTESSAPRVVSVPLTHGSRNHIWSTTTCFEFLGGQKQILLFCCSRETDTLRLAKTKKSALQRCFSPPWPLARLPLWWPWPSCYPPPPPPSTLETSTLLPSRQNIMLFPTKGYTWNVS